MKDKSVLNRKKRKPEASEKAGRASGRPERQRTAYPEVGKEAGRASGRLEKQKKTLPEAASRQAGRAGGRKSRKQLFQRRVGRQAGPAHARKSRKQLFRRRAGRQAGRAGGRKGRKQLSGGGRAGRQGEPYCKRSDAHNNVLMQQTANKENIMPAHHIAVSPYIMVEWCLVDLLRHVTKKKTKS